MAVAAADHEVRHAKDAGAGAGEEWRVPVPADEGAGEHETAKAARDRVAGFVQTIWKVGADDPRKAVHGLKVALCSVFYYVRPLYDFTGESAMWAVLTVVVVFEYTVGGCLYKGINRAAATVAGGALALGVQWVAGRSSKALEPYILTASLFVFASAATYSRFIPTMKARFDYGVTVFILTYTLVAVSGYRVDEVVALAQNRLATIAIGAAICFAVCALVAPVWAGQELHDQVARNVGKLADAVEACVDDYFSSPPPARQSGYKYKLAVLNAKASEDALANLATWEPAHGGFRLRHPYPMYQKLGAAARRCAYSVDALASCVPAVAAEEGRAAASVKKGLAGACAALGRRCAAVLREASGALASMTRSGGRLALLVDDMNDAAAELRDQLRRVAAALQEDDEQSTPLVEVLPLFTATSLLLEICARAEGVVDAVDALATKAKFKKADDHDEENNTADVEAAVSTIPAADQEKKAEMTTADHGSDQAPRDQAGELVKALPRRRSTKKWARGEPNKVGPQPPSDSTAHAPSPKGRSMDLNRSMDLTAHPRSPRHHRAGELAVAGHPPVPVALNPTRNRSVDIAAHRPVAASPRNRSVDVAGHGPVVITSPSNRSMDFANGPVLPSPRHSCILAVT